MADLPSMSLFVDDFEAATTHLSFEEDGAYNRLLRLCWRQSSCSVPDDENWIRRHMRATKEEFDRVVGPIIEEFFTRSKGRVFQKRQQREFEKAKNLVQARKSAGKKGGDAKALNLNESTSSKAKNLPQQNCSNALASTSTSITKESTGLGLEHGSLSLGDSESDPSKPDPKKFQMGKNWSMDRDVEDQLEGRFMPELGQEGFWRQVERFVEHHATAGTVDSHTGFERSLENWLVRADENREKPPKVNGHGVGKNGKAPKSANGFKVHDIEEFARRAIALYRRELAVSGGTNGLTRMQEIRLKTLAFNAAGGGDKTFGIDGGPQWSPSDLISRVRGVERRAAE